MHTEVIRSSRRKKTIQARFADGVLRVMIPASLSHEEERRVVEEMEERHRRRATSDGVDLAARAAQLSRSHGLPRPETIEFSSRQTTRWGSCIPSAGAILISDRVAGFPTWVLDYVIIHELAHLSESNHSSRFWELVERYPLAERARGFLLAIQYGASSVSADDTPS